MSDFADEDQPGHQFAMVEIIGGFEDHENAKRARGCLRSRG
jgi:hypothetical protein